MQWKHMQNRLIPTAAINICRMKQIHLFIFCMLV